MNKCNMIRTVIVIVSVLSLLSFCNNTEVTLGSSRHKSKIETHDENLLSFENYLEGIALLPMPFRVDSSNIFEFVKSDTYDMVKNNSKFFPHSKFNDTCNQSTKYIVKKVGKFIGEKIHILYLTKLNSECLNEAYDCSFILCTYDEESIESSIEIGKFYQEFGLSQYKYFEINRDTLNYKVAILSKQIGLDDENPDIEYITETKDSLSFHL